MDPLMFSVTLLQCAICSTGFLLNGFLAFTLIRNKDLRSGGCCARLILAMAIYDCLNELPLIFVPTILTLSGQTISLRLCFLLEFYGPYALLNSGTLMLLISFDRLFAAIRPIQYKTFCLDHHGKYVAFLILLPALFNLNSLYQYYNFAMANPDRQVFCMPTDFMGPAKIAQELYGSLLVILVTLSIYLAIWLLVKYKVVKKAKSKEDKRLFKSLFVLILVIFFCGVPIPVLGNFLIPNLHFLTPQLQNGLYRGLLQLNKIGQASNAPVLYMCSFDYREKMQKELARIFCRKEKLQLSSVKTRNMDRIFTTQLNTPSTQLVRKPSSFVTPRRNFVPN